MQRPCGQLIAETTRPACKRLPSACMEIAWQGLLVLCGQLRIKGPRLAVHARKPASICGQPAKAVRSERVCGQPANAMLSACKGYAVSLQSPRIYLTMQDLRLQKPCAQSAKAMWPACKGYVVSLQSLCCQVAKAMS